MARINGLNSSLKRRALLFVYSIDSMHTPPSTIRRRTRVNQGKELVTGQLRIHLTGLDD